MRAQTTQLDTAPHGDLRIDAMNAPLASRNELDSTVVNIELTLTSIIQGVALAVLAENTRVVLLEKKWMALAYGGAGLLLILLFWSRSLIHTLTLIRWPLEFGHNFFYIGCGLIETIAFTRVADPLMWFLYNAVFYVCVWGVFVYDLRLIRLRSEDSVGQYSSRLYERVNQDQQRNVRFLVPASFVFNLACAALIFLAPEFFLARQGHVILIACQLVILAAVLVYVVRAFAKLTPLIAAARAEWRDDLPEPPEAVGR